MKSLYIRPNVQTTKPCRKCGLPRTGDNLSAEGRCQACRTAYKKSHYRANQDEYVWRGNEAKQRLTQRNMNLIVDYLVLHPCLECGEDDVIVLDFDHRDPATKTSSISELACRVGQQKLLAEIAKCDVLCANCHRRKTARQLGHSRYKITCERLKEQTPPEGGVLDSSCM